MKVCESEGSCTYIFWVSPPPKFSFPFFSHTASTSYFAPGHPILVRFHSTTLPLDHEAQKGQNESTFCEIHQWNTLIHAWIITLLLFDYLPTHTLSAANTCSHLVSCYHL